MSATQIGHKQHKCNKSAIRAQYEWHDCDTNKFNFVIIIFLLFINISTGTSYQLQLTVFHVSPA